MAIGNGQQHHPSCQKKEHHTNFYFRKKNQDGLTKLQHTITAISEKPWSEKFGGGLHMQAASAKAALKATKEGIKVVRAPACRQNKTGPWGATHGKTKGTQRLCKHSKHGCLLLRSSFSVGAIGAVTQSSLSTSNYFTALLTSITCRTAVHCATTVKSPRAIIFAHKHMHSRPTVANL